MRKGGGNGGGSVPISDMQVSSHDGTCWYDLEISFTGAICGFSLARAIALISAMYRPMYLDINTRTSPPPPVLYLSGVVDTMVAVSLPS